MDKENYCNLLDTSYQYFQNEEYQKFLNAFSECYEFDTSCFSDDLNVFRFSFASYVVGKNNKLLEFNRFIKLLDKYLASLDTNKEKEDFLSKIIISLQQNFNFSLFENPIIHYPSFNNAVLVLDQQYRFLLFVNEILPDRNNQTRIEIIDEINKNIITLKKVIRFTGSRYVSNFIFPLKPRKYLKELEQKIKEL